MRSEHAAWVAGTFAAHSVPRYYVDLAANHPTHESQTKDLELQGWRGLCIEPKPRFAEMLRAERACTTIDAVIDSTEREVNFTFGKGAMGGIVDEEFDNRYHWRVRDELRPVHTRRLQDVLGSCDAPNVIDYLSVDVEGAEAQVLPASFPWQAFTFLTVTIERPPPQLSQRLFRSGYLFARTIGLGDVAFVHSTHPNATKAADNSSFVQVPAKCHNRQIVYPERNKLKGVRYNSIFGCCTFPGFPQHTMPYTAPTSISAFGPAKGHDHGRALTVD